MFAEVRRGATTLFRGFTMWRSRTGLMAQGLIPAVIAAAIVVAILIPFGLSLPALTDWATTFAENWGWWRNALRVALGTVAFIALMALAGISFTALTLAVGDWFYQKIWRGTEEYLGGVADGKESFWTSFWESVRLFVLGILIVILTIALGFIPGVGGFVAAVTGFLLTARLLARELTSRAFNARGTPTLQRDALLGANRSRVLGFGMATQLCFLVPLGAIVTMPAAVAASTMLVREISPPPEVIVPPPPYDPNA